MPDRVAVAAIEYWLVPVVVLLFAVWKLYAGLVAPIPTLPSEVIRMRSANVPVFRVLKAIAPLSLVSVTLVAIPEIRL